MHTAQGVPRVLGFSPVGGSMVLLRALLCLGLLGLSPLRAQAPLPATSEAAPQSPGLGDLLVAPTRLVFEGRKRSAELNLSNIGTSRATYRISLIRMEMDENGGIKELPFDHEAPESLRGLFRYSPREVTLEARESQTIRIQVRKPAELQAGEYRLHMMFRAVPPTAELANPSPKPAGTKGLSIRLTPIYGIAIPVILRHGETSAKVSLADLNLDPSHQTLRLRLERQGNQSVYGDLQVTLLPPSGPPLVMAEANGLAVYVPNAQRRLNLSLPKDLKWVPGSRLRVAYSLPPTEGGALLAEALLPLP